MSEDRIKEIEIALAEAMRAEDTDRLQLLLEQVPESERDGSAKRVFDIFLHMFGARIREVIDALEGAGTNDEQIDPILESMTSSEAVAVVSWAVWRRAHLEEQISVALDELNAQSTVVDNAGVDGPFMFRTAKELSEVVKLSTRICVDSGFLGVQALSDDEADATDEELEERLSDAGRLGAKLDANSSLNPYVLATRWTPMLGRKTHATVMRERGYVLGSHRTLCGRGEGWVRSAGLNLDDVDCEGCRNALLLGGFLNETTER
ncbi:MAG: hypothetical protein ACR2NR_14355 [Solirubrobacteraceae bacterium]